MSANSFPEGAASPRDATDPEAEGDGGEGRIMSLAPSFAALGLVTGWTLIPFLARTPPYWANERHQRVAAVTAALVGALVGLYVRRVYAVQTTAFRAAPNRGLRMFVSLIMASGLAGTLAGGLSDGTSRGLFEGLVIGLVCAPVALAWAWVVLHAARRAARARLGSLVAASDRRSVWATTAFAAAAVSASGVRAWFDVRTAADQDLAWQALGVAAAAAVVLPALGIADLLALRRIRRMQADVEDGALRAPESHERPEREQPDVDLGLGASVVARFNAAPAAYRARARPAFVVLGGVDEAQRALGRAVAWNALRFAAVVGVLVGHAYASRPSVIERYLSDRCQAGRWLSCKGLERYRTRRSGQDGDMSP